VEDILDSTLTPVLDRCVDRLALRSLVIVDPACGKGNFLSAARDRLVARGLSTPEAERTLVGVDIDPVALADCAGALPGARLTVDDGTTVRVDADVVIGNPPFLSQLRRRTARDPARDIAPRKPQTVRRGYMDTAAVFLDHWSAQLRAGGRLGFVMPLSFLATAACKPVRNAVVSRVRVDRLDAQPLSTFDAATYTVIVALVADGPDPRPLDRWPTWSPLVAAQFGLDPVDHELDHDARVDRVGSLATATADFRDQYYGLVGAVGDDVDGPALITTSLIGAGTCAWGQRPVRFAKRTYAAPRVELARLDDTMRAWAERRMVPKILVATQTPVIRAVIDREGLWLPSVPVLTVVPNRAEDLDRLLAALLDPRATQWALRTYLGAALSPKVIKLGAKQLLEMPLYE
jgi:hypothetical protein